MEEESSYSFNMSIEDIRLLHHCVEYRIKYWEGSPARPAEEQEKLYRMRDGLYSAMLDYNFHNM